MDKGDGRAFEVAFTKSAGRKKRKVITKSVTKGSSRRTEIVLGTWGHKINTKTWKWCGLHRQISLTARNVQTLHRNIHCVKSVRIRSYSGPHFLAFGLNTERYSLSLRIQSECRKIRIRITPNTDTFHTKMLMPVNHILQTVDHTLDIYLIKIKSSKKVKLVMRKEVMEQKRFIRTRTIYYKEELELTPRQLRHLHSITSQVTKQWQFEILGRTNLKQTAPPEVDELISELIE